jgi:hypothetical protein
MRRAVIFDISMLPKHRCPLRDIDQQLNPATLTFDNLHIHLIS